MNLRGPGYGNTDLGCPQFLLFSSVATGGENVRPSGSQQEQEEGSRVQGENSVLDSDQCIAQGAQSWKCHWRCTNPSSLSVKLLKSTHPSSHPLSIYPSIYLFTIHWFIHLTIIRSSSIHTAIHSSSIHPSFLPSIIHPSILFSCILPSFLSLSQLAIHQPNINKQITSPTKNALYYKIFLCNHCCRFL